MQKARHAPVSVKIRMQVCDVKMQHCSFEQVIYAIVGICEIHKPLHIFGKFSAADAAVYNAVAAHDIHAVMAVKFPVAQSVIAFEKISYRHHIELMDILLRYAIVPVAYKIKAKLQSVYPVLLIVLGRIAEHYTAHAAAVKFNAFDRRGRNDLLFNRLCGIGGVLRGKKQFHRFKIHACA